MSDQSGSQNSSRAELLGPSHSMSGNRKGAVHLPTERREYPRVRADTQVAIHRVEHGTQLGDAIDLGVGGIRFQCPGNELSVTDLVEITFDLGAESLTVLGNVVRVD